MKKYKEIEIFKSFIIFFGVVTFIAFVVSVIFSFKINKVYGRDICFDGNCIKNFLTFFEQVPTVINGVVQFSSYIFAIVGVYFALKTYISNLDAIKTNIHLSHLNSFRGYIESEISRFDTISWKSINLFKWYNLAFPESTTGNINISDAYIALINEINDNISESNAEARSSDNGIAFKYLKHQDKMIITLRKIGLNISRMPRNNYYEVEGVVFDFIQKVNSEFFRMSDDLKITKRLYN